MRIVLNGRDITVNVMDFQLRNYPMKKTNDKTRIIISAVLIGATVLGGCQSIGNKNKSAPVYVERPVENLYNNARDQLDKNNYQEAIQGFNEVDRQHPYSEWARRAILMSAYANYKQNKYDEAITNAQRYISMYQANQDNSAYAYYLIAICYFEQIADVGRDQRMTEMALASLNEIVQRYPNTPYAKDARLKMDMARDQLAGKEMEIGRYYLNNGEQIAAIGRFRRVVDLYQTTTHVPEALHRLVEAYTSMGLIDEATKVGAVLGYNYPGSEWYERSYNILTSKGHSPKIKPQKKGWFGKLKPAKKQTIEDVKGQALKPE